ncbi:hypothetical protein [Deinococcus radiopugnans]|uniref:hypothetical protein n=1 Tax=Deinococcus radiopugnans TaxID=57497 RepID=UPI0012E04172|nr:hypothetical protein [Deinococcus radiopugnans]
MRGPASLLPQLIPFLIIATTSGVGTVMLLETSLSFLSLDLRPPSASCGNMLTDSVVPSVFLLTR